MLARQPQRVRRDLRLDRCAHGRGSTEEAIRRCQSIQCLVRTLEVVVLHEQLDTALAILEVREHRAHQQFLPQRLPEPLDLAASLRMVRPALHVCDAVPTQLVLKLGRATPRRVLPPLVGEDLARGTIVGDAARQRFQHQRAALVMRHRKAHQIPRVIIEEGSKINPLVPTQQKREQIRLPQLVRLSALEAMLRRPGAMPHLPRDSPRACPFALQHPAHRRLRGTDAEHALHHIANAPAARLRLRCLQRHDHRTTRFATATWLRLRRARPGHQPRFPARAITLHPLKRRRVRHPQLQGNLICAQVLFNHRTREAHTHLHRPRLSTGARHPVRGSRTPCLVLACHLPTPLLILRQINRQTSARELRHHPSAHEVVRGANVQILSLINRPTLRLKL